MTTNNIELGIINFRGYEGYVAESRIKKSEEREGLYYYHLRHSDDSGEPVTLEDAVVVNHWGVMVFKESIDHLLSPWGNPNEDGKYRLETDLSEEEIDNIWFAVNENKVGYVKHMDI